MKSLKYQTLIGGTLLLALLAGCNNKTQEAAPAPMPTPQMSREAPVATSREQLTYYSQNLDEARETWRQCRQAKASDLTEEVRARCVAAQSAWETQPYKPQGRK